MESSLFVFLIVTNDASYTADWSKRQTTKLINVHRMILIVISLDLTEDEELQGMIQELKESGKQTRELRRTQSNSSRT